MSLIHIAAELGMTAKRKLLKLKRVAEFHPKAHILMLWLLISLSMYYIFFLGCNKPNRMHPIFNKSSSLMCYGLKRPSLPRFSEFSPKKGNSIFFMETSCKSYLENRIIISARQACAVESAAKMNPNKDIFLLYASAAEIKNDNSTNDKYLQALASYDNVNILHMDIEYFVSNTIVEKVFFDGALDKSLHAVSHASDLLRYLILYKYGGIYMDLDVIVIKSFDDFPPNFVGVESSVNLACGVIGFDYQGIGHQYVEDCLLDLQKTFKGWHFTWNGPGTITRLLQKLCEEKNPIKMPGKTCKNFDVYPPNYFYPVHWQDWKIYFNSNKTEMVEKLAKNSYTIHMWNKLSKNHKITKGSKVPYEVYFEKYCPKVYSASDTYI